MLDTLVVSGVAGHELQAVRQGDSGDHRIAAADGAADAVQIAGDMAGQVSGCLVEKRTTSSAAMALRKA